MSANLFHCSHDPLNVFFEAKLEHHISLIKDNGLKALKIDIASLYVIKYSTSCSYK
jgi:hypothetical protein